MTGEGGECGSPRDRSVTGRPEYGSDVVVDVLGSLRCRYLPMSPGASFRGLHDSVVTYGGNVMPELLTCLHEEIAVALAHGYAKATGTAGVAAVHDLVGLMHASMAVYNAYCDQAPLVVIGGSGPSDPAKRRPIDWTHAASTQGLLVRDYVKWDTEVASPELFGSSLLRAHTVAVTGPPGPTYVSLDAAAQEAALAADVADTWRRQPVDPPRLWPDPQDVEKAADILASSERVLVVGGRLGRDTTSDLVGLVEVLGAAYQDERHFVDFPTKHPQNCNGDSSIVGEVDALVAVGVTDLPGLLHGLGASRPLQVVELSYADLGIGSWSHRSAAAPEPAHRVVADPDIALAELTRAVRERGRDRESRRAWAVERSRYVRTAALAAVESSWAARPISPARLVGETWKAVRELDWLLLLRNHRTWPEGVWEFDGAGQFLGHSGGGGVGYGPGAMVGGALAARDAGKLGVGIVGDGDLLMAPGALWTAVHHHIPMLVVVNDNGSYYNSEEHQAAIARQRGRAVDAAGVGVRIDAPEVVVSELARSFGCWASGRITDPDQLGPALRAARHEALAGAVAVVHARTASG